MTLTYAILRSTRLHKPQKPQKPVEKKIKSETHFCPKKKGGHCTCSKKKT